MKAIFYLLFCLSWGFFTLLKWFLGEVFRSCFGPEYHQYPGQDEGQAQELTHVELHSGLKGNLVVFHKFNKEPGCKKQDHKYAEDIAVPYFEMALPVKGQQNDKDQDVAQGLIELGGMPGNGGQDLPGVGIV